LVTIIPVQLTNQFRRDVGVSDKATRQPSIKVRLAAKAPHGGANVNLHRRFFSGGFYGNARIRASCTRAG
jgi:hypothetical protein